MATDAEMLEAEHNLRLHALLGNEEALEALLKLERAKGAEEGARKAVDAIRALVEKHFGARALQ